MTGPTLALAASPRGWPDRLHRFFIDHGGARVRLHVLRGEDVLVEDYQILLVDDVCSFLTPHLVARVKEAGRAVVGVFDASEFPEGKDRLLECGIPDVVEAAADPEEFLAVLMAAATTVDETVPPAPIPGKRRAGGTVTVAGPPGGVGITEVAVGLAGCLARRRRGAGLVDADATSPSVAQRLGLPLHPNLVTAVDAVMYTGGDPVRWTLPLADTGLRVVPGAPPAVVRHDLHEHEVTGVVERILASGNPVVVDAGSGPGSDRPLPVTASVLGSSAVLVGVVAPTPVGVARFLDWVSILRAGRRDLPVVVAVNRAPRSRYRRQEVATEILRSFSPVRLTFLPDDSGVAAAAWNGALVDRGPFRRSCDRLADHLVPFLEAP